jgi:hypothetical protein
MAESSKNICYKCRQDIPDKLLEEKRLLIYEPFSEFIKIEDLDKLTKIDSDVSIAVSKAVFDKILADDSYTKKYAANRASIEKLKVICPNCNEAYYYDITGSINYALFNNLQELKLEFIENMLLKKYGPYAISVFNVLGSSYKKLPFIRNEGASILPDSIDEIRILDDRISVFYYGNGKGGDEFPIIQIATDFLSNELVKNALYDLIKAGSVYLVTRVIKKIKTKKIEKQLEESLNVDVTRMVEYEIDREYKTDIMSYLTNKERRKLLKIIIRRISTEKANEIKKARKSRK